MISHYLTDTLNFRICIGEFDNTVKHFSYNCIANSIEIIKSETSNGGGLFHIIETKTYDIKKLNALQNTSKSEIENISDKYLIGNR